MMKFKLNWDKLGITSSTLCVFHCALIPILAIIGSVELAHILHHPVIEIFFFGFAILFFTLSLRGKIVQNGLLPWYFYLGIMGFMALIFGHYLPLPFGPIVSIFGGVSIIGAHYLNLTDKVHKISS